MRRVLPLKIALASLLIAACVTINVYFPAAAADKAADETIDKILKGGDAPTPPQGFLVPEREKPSLVLVAFDRMLSAAIPAAQAQGADALDKTSPAIIQITNSMATRMSGMKKFFASGAIGLTNNGNIEVRDLNAVALPDRATVKRLVGEDNADRAQLYAEMAKANDHPEWEADIRKSFARRWVVKAESGWYYQDESGAWKQK